MKLLVDNASSVGSIIIGKRFQMPDKLETAAITDTGTKTLSLLSQENNGRMCLMFRKGISCFV
jgi:hypothetical protein